MKILVCNFCLFSLVYAYCDVSFCVVIAHFSSGAYAEGGERFDGVIEGGEEGVCSRDFVGTLYYFRGVGVVNEVYQRFTFCNL